MRKLVFSTCIVKSMKVILHVINKLHVRNGITASPHTYHICTSHQISIFNSLFTAPI